MGDENLFPILTQNLENIYEVLDELEQDTNDKIEELEKVLASLTIALFGLSGLVDSIFKVISKDPEQAQFLDHNMQETMKQILEMANNAGASGVGEDHSPDSATMDGMAEEL